MGLHQFYLDIMEWLIIGPVVVLFMLYWLARLIGFFFDPADTPALRAVRHRRRQRR